jgi:hypothetical protein
MQQKKGFARKVPVDKNVNNFYPRSKIMSK